MKAILLSGGLGTRLRPLTLTTPKALIDINGKTITEHLLDLLKKYNIKDIFLSIGYLKEKIKDYFGNGAKFDVNIKYIEDKEGQAAGTAVPLLMISKLELDSTFVVTNGDQLLDINIDEMLEQHKKTKATVTIALTEVEDPSQYGVAKMEGQKIVEFVEKPKKEDAPSNLISSGFYIMEPEVLSLISPDSKGFAMLEKQVFPKLAEQGKLYGFPFKGQWFDTGTFERLDNVRKNWKGID